MPNQVEMIENFQIEDMLEQTPRFVVYKALNKQSGRKCYLKRYLVDDASGLGRIENWPEKYQKIIDDFTRLNVPNLRSIIHGGLDPQDGSPYAVFEWLEVSSLAELIVDKPSLGLRFTREMTEASLKALSFLHEKGLAHGGVNPESIFFTDSDDKNRWILNWDPIRSLRCKYDVNRFEIDDFTAPELLSGGHATIQSDLFALAKTAEQAAGIKASEQSFRTWMGKMTTPVLLERFKTASEAIAELPQYVVAPAGQASAQNRTQLLVGSPSPHDANQTSDTATPSHQKAHQKEKPSAAEVAPTKKKSRGLLVGLLMLVLAITALAGGYFLMKNQKSEKTATNSVYEDAEISSSQETSSLAEVSEGEAPTERVISDSTAKDSASSAPVPKFTITQKGPAARHIGEIIQVEGYVKAITINKLGNVADFHFTRAKYRQRTLNVRGSLKLVQGDNLKQLQERYIGKKIRATGRLVNKNGVFIVILLKKDTFHLVGANLTE